MTLQGTIKNGVVVLDQPQPLADGTRVDVIVPDERGKSTLEGVLKLAGTLADLPDDMAAQHDHYVHGTPKR
jgi:hypothetical protein